MIFLFSFHLQSLVFLLQSDLASFPTWFQAARFGRFCFCLPVQTNMAIFLSLGTQKVTLQHFYQVLCERSTYSLLHVMFDSFLEDFDGLPHEYEKCPNMEHLWYPRFHSCFSPWEALVRTDPTNIWRIRVAGTNGILSSAPGNDRTVVVQGGAGTGSPHVNCKVFFHGSCSAGSGQVGVVDISPHSLSHQIGPLRLLPISDW